MFDLRRIPILRVLLPFAGGAGGGLGILRAGGMPDLSSLNTQAWILVAMFGLCILQLLIYRRTGQTSGFSGKLFILLAFTLYLLSGLVSSMVSRSLDPGLPLDKKILIRGEITEGPLPGKNNWSCGMKVGMVCCGDSVFGLRTHLKVYLKVPSAPEAASVLPRPGETWQLYGRLSAIRSSGNPGAPDYKEIMARKNCWYRFYAEPYMDPYRGREVPGRRITGDMRVNPGHIRRTLSSQWEGNDADVSLLRAVCLGDRSELTSDMKQAYSHAGAMHLLAVSGLHLGLIWWVLHRLFFWITRISGKEIYRSTVLISLLWIFAFVSGFSSSVCRAACMFTLFTAGRLMDQRMHALNGILVSAFLLILIRPQNILDVGFQLSYAAILGIVSIYPALRSLLRIRNKILRRIWEASLVSLSAQVSTAPLVIYYFHQIPVYSLFTSLITIPLLSVLISLFVVSVPFFITGLGSSFFNALLVRLAGLMNFLVEGIASFPGAVIEKLHINTAGLCLWMLMLITGMLLLHHRTRTRFWSFLMVVLVSLSMNNASLTRYRWLHSSEMQISHFYNASLLTFREGDQVDHFCWYRDSAVFSNIREYMAENWNSRTFQSRIIHPLECEGGCGSVSASRLVAPGLMFIGNDRCRGWLVSGAVDLKSEGMQDYLSENGRITHSDFVLLSASPLVWRIPVELLSGSDQVILDGSNPGWYPSQLERYRVDFSLAFDEYMTYEHGAYLKRW